ncbi:MAG: DUF5076 domain-containing protein [Flavisolibacter sp.]
MTELPIPPVALEDNDSFELLRVWAAYEEQHVSIHSGLNGSAKDFGFLIAELAMHGAKLYAERFRQSEEEMLSEILQGFNNEIQAKSGNPTGGIENGV